MKTINRTQTTLIIIASLFFILSGILLIHDRNIKNSLNYEKIRSENLLSEKLDLQKSIDAFKKDMAALKGKNKELDKIVAETNVKLSKKESEIKKLKSENASLAELRAKYAELEALRAELDNQIATMNMDMNRMTADNEKLVEQLASMKNSNESLAMQNAILEALLADNYQAEALKGKQEKLTINSRRANTLRGSFDIPSEAGEQLYFKVLTPEGTEISSLDDKTATIRHLEQDRNMLASLAGGAGSEAIMSQRIEFAYKPDYKLTRGTYKFNVYDGKEYLGSVQLRLR